MHLRFLAPLHACLKLVLRAACLCAAVATAVQAQQASVRPQPPQITGTTPGPGGQALVAP